MYCHKCQGRVFVDRVFTSDIRMELFCSMCGKRWMLKNNKNGFTEWLHRKESQIAKANAGTTSI